VTGDLRNDSPADLDLFDETVEDGVRRFQERHGLEVDGVVGRRTFAAFNEPLESRIRRIELNLERWRWLPQELGQRHILVNIAGFDLVVYEDQHQVDSMKVVVGRTYRRTPVFSDLVTYLVFNPSWQVPPTLASQDILPKIRKDPAYLTLEKFEVLRGWGADTEIVDPSTVDWHSISIKESRLRFRQRPGPNNALGQVKFMFPNKFNVYLHGTPTRELFEKAERTYSSDCIRLESPIALAEYLLEESPDWSIDRILETISKGVEQTVRLPQKVSIHILCWTAWADEDGTIHFRNDIYGRDKLLDQALRKKRTVSRREEPSL
jgi:murein L,D-transpeptidase YcbB/YkuD